MSKNIFKIIAMVYLLFQNNLEKASGINNSSMNIHLQKDYSIEALLGSEEEKITLEVLSELKHIPILDFEFLSESTPRYLNDLGIMDNQTNRLFIHAVTLQNIETIEYSVRAGADIDRAHNNGFTSLIIATEQNNIEIIRLLINLGANVNSRYKQLSPLVAAALKNNCDIAQLFIQVGADVNIETNEGYTLLHFLLNHKTVQISSEMKKLLIESGAHE